MSNPGLPNFQGSKTSSQSRQMHRKEKKITASFSYMGPQCEEMCIFGYFIHIWGGPAGPLCQTQGYQTFRAVRPHHRADKCIGRKQNNCQFFIYGPPM